MRFNLKIYDTVISIFIVALREKNIERIEISLKTHLK